MGQVYCPLWVAQKDFNGPGSKFCLRVSWCMTDLCELMGTQKIWTSLYHPQTNGQCERFNSTLINMLGTLCKEKKSEWKNHIGMLVHTYNCTWNSATGFSPYYLMYGRQPCLPVDVTLGLAPHTIMKPNTSKFVQKMREHAKWAQRKAKAFQAKEVQRHKQNYNKRCRAAALEVRDTVLVCITAFKGHQKFKIDGKIGNMLWKSGPISMCQLMWYAPGMGKGTARPCIGTICFPSILKWSRAKWINPWPELEIPPLWLQCHLWIVHLLMQDCLGWTHQAQWVAHPRVVQIDLPYLDTAPKPPRTNFHGGTRTLVCWQILGWPASGMHRLACVSVCILCSVCILFSGEVQCKTHSTYNIICLPSTTHFNIQGNTLNAAY